jgi:hypothetical protein
MAESSTTRTEFTAAVVGVSGVEEVELVMDASEHQGSDDGVCAVE